MLKANCGRNSCQLSQSTVLLLHYLNEDVVLIVYP